MSVCLPQRDCSSAPVWQLQQWANAHDIADAIAGTFSWELLDASHRVQKRVQISPRDPVNGDVTLEMNGLSEFLERTDSAGMAPQYLQDLRSPWPHWLLSQQLDSGRLMQYRRLQLHGQVKLLFDDRQRLAGYDAGIHAARLLLAITVRNRLTGDYFWITVPLYDDRYPSSSFGCEKCAEDGSACRVPAHVDDPGVWRCPEDRVGEQWWRNEKTGTARMIFRVPTHDFVRSPLAAGQWVQVSGDLLPYVQAGIEAVRQRENGHRFPADPFFYELGLFSIGWEITGFNHVAAQLRDWQLYAHR